MTANFYCFSQNGTHTLPEDWRLESKYLFLYQTLLINIQSALLRLLQSRSCWMANMNNKIRLELDSTLAEQNRVTPSPSPLEFDFGIELGL